MVILEAVGPLTIIIFVVLLLLHTSGGKPILHPCMIDEELPGIPLASQQHKLFVQAKARGATNSKATRVAATSPSSRTRPARPW